jgi:N-acetylneuraminic acid mutarotase
VLAAFLPVATAQADWTAAQDMGTGRADHTQVALTDSKVLAAGGETSAVLCSSPTDASETYNYSSGSWTSQDHMNVGRADAQAVALPNAKALVAGGCAFPSGGDAAPTDSAEVYDDSDGSWTLTQSMHTVREHFNLVALQNGKVLAVGGATETGSTVQTATAEIYDRTTGAWTTTDSMSDARSDATATVLNDGKVLVAGGLQNGTKLDSAELYDPDTGHWTATDSLNTARYDASAALLSNGDVLVVGGIAEVEGADGNTTSAEIYDPTTGTWTAADSMNASHGQQPAIGVLQGGDVLVAGDGSSEVYDPTADSWASVDAPLTFTFEGSEGTMMDTGQFLFTGGWMSGPSTGTTNAAEVLAPVTCQDMNESTGKDRELSAQLDCTDIAGATLTYGLDSSPAHGTVQLTDPSTGEFTYTPDAGFTGSDSFLFGAGSANGGSSQRTVSISVLPPPSCESGALSVVSGASVVVPMSCTDAGGAALTYVIDSGPSHGTLGSIDQGTGRVTYTPAPGYTGSDSLTFHANSSNGTSATKTVSMTVAPAPASPGSGGATPPVVSPRLPGLSAAFRSLSMKAHQRGRAISGSLMIALSGSKFTGVLRFRGAAMGHRTARNLHAGRYRFKITLSRSGLRTLRRRHSLRLAVKLTVTGPGVKSTTVTRSVTLRA